MSRDAVSISLHWLALEAHFGALDGAIGRNKINIVFDPFEDFDRAVIELCREVLDVLRELHFRGLREVIRGGLCRCCLSECQRRRKGDRKDSVFG